MLDVWPGILIAALILMLFATGGRAGLKAAEEVAAQAGNPPPTPLEKLAGVVLAAIILVELTVLAVHGLALLAYRVGGWWELVGVACWIIFLANIPLGCLFIIVRGLYTALRPIDPFEGHTGKSKGAGGRLLGE